MESTGKKSEEKQHKNEGVFIKTPLIASRELSNSINELNDLIARARAIISGDPGVKITYHGSQARGV